MTPGRSAKDESGAPDSDDESEFSDEELDALQFEDNDKDNDKDNDEEGGGDAWAEEEDENEGVDFEDDDFFPSGVESDVADGELEDIDAFMDDREGES